jgi:hypothetical protein
VPAYLEAVQGPAAGQKIEVKSGESVIVGSGEHVMARIAGDSVMSDMHFAVSFASGAFRIQNLSKSDGTLIEGRRVESAVVKPGERITAGATTFVVVAPPPSPFPAELQIGGWGFASLPQGWELIEGIGLRLASEQGFIPTISAGEGQMPNGLSLDQYIDLQVQLIRENVKGSETQGPINARVQGAEEAKALLVKSPSPAGTVVQRQIYAVHSGLVGVFTVSMLESQAPRVNPAAATVVSGLSFVHT